MPLAGKSGLPKIDPKSKPTQGEDISGCDGLYPDSQQWSMSAHAQYDGFAVATNPCIAFSQAGTSRVGFWDDLPTAFSDGNTGPETSQVVLDGSDVPAVSDLDTNAYGTVARAHAHPKPVIAGTFPTVKAIDKRTRPQSNGKEHTADDDGGDSGGNLPGFPNIPDCPPSTNGKSGLTIPNNSDLGPIQTPVGASFCYISSTGDFVGNLQVNIPGPAPINGVEVGFEIGHGHLIDAGGEVSGNIPVFPAVLINDFKFDIQTDPTEVAAAITASIADLLDVTGGVIVKPSLPEVDFEGSVGIAGITFGNFSISYVKQYLEMSVDIGKDFGPASLNIDVNGAMMTQKPYDFYLQGTGQACLFICLTVKGLVSTNGLAACGSINLLFVTFSGGVAVMWSGPNSGVHLFTGCNLEPFIPAPLQAVAAQQNSQARHGDARARDALPDASQTGPTSPVVTPPAIPTTTQTPLQPGQSTTLNLDQYTSNMCPPSYTPPPADQSVPGPSGCTTQTIAVQVHSPYNPNDPGATPLVSLTGPSGDGRVATTETTPGYWGLDATASSSGGAATPDDADTQTDGNTWLVDQNPVPVDDEVPDSTANCPTTDSSTLVGLPSTCEKVTTTTIYIADPGPRELDAQRALRFPRSRRCVRCPRDAADHSPIGGRRGLEGRRQRQRRGLRAALRPSRLHAQHDQRRQGVPGPVRDLVSEQRAEGDATLAVSARQPV